LKTCQASYIVHVMAIDKAVREFLKKQARKGGKARARKYDKKTLSQWAKRGGRPRTKKEGAQ
jgi:hypothetical protein